MKARAYRITALSLFVVGIAVALTTGMWRVGALVFSAGAIFLGLGTIAGGGDKAVGKVMVFIGALAVLGVVAHMLTGL